MTRALFYFRRTLQIFSFLFLLYLIIRTAFPLESKIPVDLYLRPGCRFRFVDHLVTNFHLPKSSLLVLVSAFAGREHILSMYKEAIRREYRFYSYGDATLIL